MGFITLCLLAAGAWFLIDLGSNSTLENLIAPVIFAFFLLAIMLKLAHVFGFSRDNREIGGFGDDGDSDSL